MFEQSSSAFLEGAAANSAAFLTSSLLAVSVFAAPSKSLAERPPVPATKIGAPLALAQAREFDASALQTLGIDYEDLDVKSAALAQAKNYSEYRNNSRLAARLRFLAACSGSGSPSGGASPYCAIESARLASSGAFASKKAETKKLRAERLKAKAALDAQDLGALKDLSYASLAAATLSYGEYADMKSVSEKVADKSQTCDYGEAAAALASKMEDFFPEDAAVASALLLYEKAADCASPSTAARARYRYSLLQIWKGKCAEAEPALQALEAAPAGFAFRSRAKYWRIYCALDSKHDDLAASLRDELRSEHPLSFHNLAANASSPDFQDSFGPRRIEPSSTSDLEFKDIPKVAFRSAIRPEANESLRAIEALMTIGKFQLAGDAVERLTNVLSSLEPEVRLYVASLMNRAEQSDAKFRMLAQLFQDRPRWATAQTLKLYFPLSYYQETKKRSGEIDPLLMLSLMRQESAFNAKARSGAGARGLMQVMPSTARAMAFGRAGRKLYDPLVNLTVGSSVFRRSLERFAGDVELTLAAYNAGPERVARWEKRYPTENRILFLDLIPYKETRDYVSSILRNYYWYVELYSESALEAEASAQPKSEALPRSPALANGQSGDKLSVKPTAAQGAAAATKLASAPSAKLLAIISGKSGAGASSSKLNLGQDAPAALETR